MFKVLKSTPNSFYVESTKDIIIISQPQRLPSLKHRFPNSDLRRQYRTSCFANYLITGTPDDNKRKRPSQFDRFSSVSYTAPDTMFPEYRMLKQFILPLCFPIPVKIKKDYASPERDQKGDLPKDLVSHCLKVTTRSPNNFRNNRATKLAAHRIPVDPPPSPPRGPTYPPTCPPSLAPPYPVPAPSHYKPMPVFLPGHSRQRCDVPMPNPYYMYPQIRQPPNCPPLTNPLRDTRLPKR